MISFSFDSAQVPSIIILMFLVSAMQTGSGKTHTMWGPMPDSGSELMATEERGVTPRVFEQLFARIQQVFTLLQHILV